MGGIWQPCQAWQIGPLENADGAPSDAEDALPVL